MSIQLKRGSVSNIDQNYVLKQGQPGIDMRQGNENWPAQPYKMKIGDGVSKWSNLPYLGEEYKFWTTTDDLGIFTGDAPVAASKINSLTGKGFAFLPRNYTIQGDVIFNVPVYFPLGANLTIEQGSTCTFNKEVYAGRYQILQPSFLDALHIEHPVTYIFKMNPEIYPEWFGWSGNNVDHADSANCCIQSSKDTAIHFGPGNYVANYEITTSSDIKIVGYNKDSTSLTIQLTGDTNVSSIDISNIQLTNCNFKLSNTAQNTELELYNCNITANQRVINMSNCIRFHVSKCNIDYSGENLFAGVGFLSNAVILCEDMYWTQTADSYSAWFLNISSSSNILNNISFNNCIFNTGSAAPLTNVASGVNTIKFTNCAFLKHNNMNTTIGIFNECRCHIFLDNCSGIMPRPGSYRNNYSNCNFEVRNNGSVYMGTTTYLQCTNCILDFTPMTKDDAIMDITITGTYTNCSLLCTSALNGTVELVASTYYPASIVNCWVSTKLQLTSSIQQFGNYNK